MQCATDLMADVGTGQVNSAHKHRTMAMFSALLLATTVAVITAQNPVCEICGCSFCPPGFMMQNPNGLITITQEILDEFGGIVVPGPDGDATLESVLAQFGFVAGSVLPCSLLDTAASNDLIPIEGCIDVLRLNPIIRDTCGCPAVPDPPTNAPSQTPSNSNYPVCEVCGSGFFVGNPSGLLPNNDPGSVFTATPCGLIDFAGNTSQIPPAVCDIIQNDSFFRETCDCTVLPNTTDAGSPQPSEAPTSAPVSTTVNPVCEICGCSFCPPGFTVGNPSGTVPIPEEFADLAPPGFTEIPCSLLDFAGTSGQIPESNCTDDNRLDPEFREACGCPMLPGETAFPTGSPQPSKAPSKSPQPTTSAQPSRFCDRFSGKRLKRRKDRQNAVKTPALLHRVRRRSTWGFARFVAVPFVHLDSLWGIPRVHFRSLPNLSTSHLLVSPRFPAICWTLQVPTAGFLLVFASMNFAWRRNFEQCVAARNYHRHRGLHRRHRR